MQATHAFAELGEWNVRTTGRADGRGDTFHVKKADSGLESVNSYGDYANFAVGYDSLHRVTAMVNKSGYQTLELAIIHKKSISETDYEFVYDAAGRTLVTTVRERTRIDTTIAGFQQPVRRIKGELRTFYLYDQSGQAVGLIERQVVVGLETGDIDRIQSRILAFDTRGATVST